MAVVSTQWQFLERDPLSSYRQLSIKGRRIKARTLYGLYCSAEEPMSKEEIAEAYQLPLAAVEEAISYCDSDPWEIHQDWLQEEALIEASGMNHPDYRFNAKALYRFIPLQELAAIRKRIDEMVPPK